MIGVSIIAVIICIAIYLIWEKADQAILSWELEWIPNSTIRLFYRWFWRIILGTMILLGSIMAGIILGFISAGNSVGKRRS